MAKGDLAEGKTKEKRPAAVKRPTKKKPKDKPKRPLSAYNFFFKEEREKILKVVLAEDPVKVGNEPGADDFLDEEAINRLKKEGGKVSFEEMGKIIGQRWKNIDPDRLATYSEMAGEDTERYKNEMQIYNGRQEAKMRSEALKPPVQYPNSSGVGGPRGPEGYAGVPPPGVDPSRGVVGGYPEQMANMSAFANPAAAAGMAAAQAQGYNPYGGMDFGGYGAAMQMGAYGMGAYGGYGMGGAAQDAMQMRGAQEMPGAYGGGGYGAAAMQQMMQGGYQGQMMGYGGGAPEYGAQYPPEQHPPPGPPHGGPHAGMYGGGYGGGQGWGGQ